MDFRRFFDRISGRISDESKRHFKTNGDVRRYWYNKKTALRLKVAILASFVFVVGVELASPNYSLTEAFSQHFVAESSFLSAAIEKEMLVSVLQSYVGEDTDLTQALRWPAKTVAFALIFIFFVFFSRGTIP